METMDKNRIKAVVKSNVHDSRSSVLSLSSAEDEDGDRSNNSLRYSDRPMGGRSVKEFEELLASLKKENFNLKIRIYFLEERMGANFSLDKENVLKKNVELSVENESLKKELQEKHNLLCQAVKAMDLEEDEFKKTAQAKNEEILNLKRELEELRSQFQDGRYDTDDSSQKSYHSEPLFFSAKSASIAETNGMVKMLQERITILENELVQEKENSASLQMLLDHANSTKAKFDELQAECLQKDDVINSLRKEVHSVKDSAARMSTQMKEVERARDEFRLESQKLSRLLLEKTKAAEEAEENATEIKRKYSALKLEHEREKQKSERCKLVSDMKVTELEEDLERQKQRVQDLQKRLAAAGQELKENQNLLVPKSPTDRSMATYTDCDNVSVANAAASPGVQKENALRESVAGATPSPSSKSPVKTFNFDAIYKILNTVSFKIKPQLLQLVDELKERDTAFQHKIVRLKAQELKACALVKNLMQYLKNAEEQNEVLQKKLNKLEKELEGVVSKPEGALSNDKAQEKVDSTVGDGYRDLVQELESKLQILELTLKEKDVHIQYIEARNLELQNNIQAKEKDLIDLETSMSSQNSRTEKSGEISEKTYSKLFDEKNKEIEKLNEELRKRTHDLQAVVNQELWQKNREIEKLQTKYTQLLETKEKEMMELKDSFSALSMNLNELRNENEEKHIENTNLKIDISDLRLQLQLLRDKIGEIGLVPDDKLEVEIIISSLDEVKNIQKQLDDVKQEKETLTKKINELESAVQVHEGSNQLLPQLDEFESLRKELKTSEALRLQTTEVCHILRAQLEELAVFLDSLMKQKSVLGFLGSTQNRKLREAIDHSLDLSKSLNMSLSMNPEQSLMQLSNLTSLLNCSGVSMSDSNRYSFSIMPEQATITYQSHLFRVEDENDNKSFLMKSLEDQIQMLQRELNLKNIELNRYRRESRSFKDSKSSHSKPRISPNKLRSSITVRSEHHDSESEAWSEPDVNVSKARIGLFKDNQIAGVQEIQSSESTDESLTHLDYKKSDILNECQVTITMLTKQVQELTGKLREKENRLMELQDMIEASNSLKEENSCLVEKIGSLENELQITKTELDRVCQNKAETESEMNFLKEQMELLEISKKELMDCSEKKNKDLCDKLNKMEVERDHLVKMASEYASMTETSRQEIIELENKLTQLSVEKENVENKLRKEYNEKMTKEVENVERQLMGKLRETEKMALERINEMTKKISEVTENYEMNYVKKSVIAEKNSEIEHLNSKLKMTKESLENAKEAAALSELLEGTLKKEIDELQAKVSKMEAQLEEAVKEKERLRTELSEEYTRSDELKRKYEDAKEELERLKESYNKDVDSLHAYKSKLELKVSELEFCNADLHNKLAKLNEQCRLSSSPVLDTNRSVPINQVSPYSRQVSINSQFSQSYASEDDVKTRGPFSIVVPQKSLDSERVESNASPDLGIESDQGRFSSLEAHAQVSRPLRQTIEIAESMSNLLGGDNNSVQGSACDNKSCYQKSQELYQENNNLKKKLLKTRKALEDTVTQLTLANQRKKLVEKNICRQIHKTSQVLREAKANLDSGSETDFHKK